MRVHSHSGSSTPVCYSLFAWVPTIGKAIAEDHHNSSEEDENVL